MRLRDIGVEFERDTVLFACFVVPIGVPQGIAIFQVRPRSPWQIGYDPGITLQYRRRAVRLSNPKRRQRDDKDRDPLQSVEGPAWQKIICCGRGDSSGQAEGLARRTLANFPNEPIVVKME